MGSVREKNGKGFYDFRYKNKRCKEYTGVPATKQNLQIMKQEMEKIEAEIILGIFDYKSHFPNSTKVALFASLDEKTKQDDGIPSFKAFSQDWFEENEGQWKKSYIENIRGIIDKYLLPQFGDKNISHISKTDIKKYRGNLAKDSTPGKKISADRTNHVMAVMNQIVTEAADRFDFNNIFNAFKPLKVPKPDIYPMTFSEVNLFLRKIRPDFRDYYLIRFFTAMRTGEIDGLQWQYVDLKRREILIRETVVKCKIETPKNLSSYRTIEMSSPVFEAFSRQYKVTGKTNKFVFCNAEGNVLDHSNVSKRIWHPMLRHLGLKARPAYQSRHTAATLWLSAGENPTWIAMQMGHSNTRMLFERYSRYVKDASRNDGSTFEKLLMMQLDQHNKGNTSNE